MSDRRYLIAALVCFLLGLWCASAMSQDFTALGGIGSSHRMGERSPFGVVYGELRGAHLALEAGWDSADKIETGDGWLANGALDVHTGPLTLGAAYTHRHTGAWTKDVWWLRLGVEHHGLWLLAIVAPTSPNMEARVEARYRLTHGHLVLEPRYWVGWHRQAEELGGYASGLEMLVGFGTQKHVAR